MSGDGSPSALQEKYTVPPNTRSTSLGSSINTGFSGKDDNDYVIIIAQVESARKS